MIATPPIGGYGGERVKANDLQKNLPHLYPLNLNLYEKCEAVQQQWVLVQVNEVTCSIWGATLGYHALALDGRSTAASLK